MTNLSAAAALRPTTGFWSGKRVFLTGHTGFKGAWLSHWLLSLGAELRGFALAPATEPSMFQRTNLGGRLDHVEGDLRDLEHVVSSVREFQPEIILHLAAQSLVRRAYREPVPTFATNVLGTVHVLEACRQVDSVTAVVMVTTDKCYENPEWVWPFRETDRLGGNEPYGVSKACGELAVSAYNQAYFQKDDRCRVATARAGNVIGGGDWSEDRLIPDTVRAILSGSVLGVRNPQAVRPWQHVVEPLLGYLMLAKALHIRMAACPQAVNFGPNVCQCATVREVVSALYSAWEQEHDWRHAPEENAPCEANRLTLDSSLAAATLDWVSSITLQDTLQETVRWYRAEARGASAEELTELSIEQIHRLSRTGS